MMVQNLESLVMDVETAFLYGEIDEEIFMKSPVGMEEVDPDHLQKTVTNSYKEYMVCAKQPDNFGRNLSTQQKRNLLDFQ